MRSKFILCLLALVLVAAITAEGAETPKFIPDGCVAVVTISNIQTDLGISWMLDAWIKSPRQSPLREFLASIALEEMSMAVFPQKGDSLIYILSVVDLAEGAKIDKEKLNRVVMPDTAVALKSISYKGADITFVAEEDTLRAFSAYAIFQDQVLVGTGVDLLKKAIDGPSVKKSPGYQEVEVQFPQVKDGLLFADNSGSRFVNFLSPLEEKWKMTLLLAAEYLEWMGSSFDVIDSTRVTGEVVFQGADLTHIEDIRDDAEFLGEAFKRKFIAEKIEYSSEVGVKDRTVTLKFRVAGLAPLWRELFEKGVLSLIQPGAGE